MDTSDTITCTFLIFMAGMLLPSPAAAEDQLGQFFSDGAFSGQLRYRYEYVNQGGLSPLTTTQMLQRCEPIWPTKLANIKKSRDLLKDRSFCILGRTCLTTW